MILKIRKSRSFKLVCITLALSIFFEVVAPRQAFALTGGPAQPEFNSFTPIGTSDMVDLSSGDFNYNLPLMDVGGYPLNMAYSGNVSMDQEASWVGLGWNLSVGQINRNVRGLPDDFDGDEMRYENYVKPNVTVGVSFKGEPGIVGIEGAEENEVVDSSLTSSFGVSVIYNNYTGLTVKPSFGMNREYKNAVSVGFNAESGPDGLVVSPTISLHKTVKDKNDKDTDLKRNFGLSMNSRQGLTAVTLSSTRKSTYEKTVKDKDGTKTSSHKSTSSVGSSISFADPLYTPSKRVGMETGSFTVNAQLGSEIFGGELSGEVTAYGTVMKIKKEEKDKTVKAYGYANTENASMTSILDFNREKDGSFSENTTNAPITNYTYDIYSVQGQGVGGTYRPYRNQVGYVYDSYVSDGSFSGSLGLEFGTGNLFQFGIDIEASGVSSHSGVWNEQTGMKKYLELTSSTSAGYEKVHYKNVGDLSADKDYGMFGAVGGYNPASVELAGWPFLRKTSTKYAVKNSSNSVGYQSVGAPIARSQRQNRNQAIYNITRKEAEAGVGYGPIAYGDVNYSLPSDAKDHHTTEVQIIRNDGARYVYGLPAYNTVKKEATFAVDGAVTCATGLVTYEPYELDDPKSLPNDKYFNRITTPGYVHTHLLTSVLSTDYQDRTGNGPSTDDLGSYTKFSYNRIPALYKWRVPYEQDHANYNEGLKTDPKDDQGNYVYGEKELYYVNQIETKTHVAVFHYSARKDAKGVLGEHGGKDNAQSMYKLDMIKLYSIGEYDGLGVSSASTPIKTVHFEYSYSLCPGVPNNDTGASLDANELSNEGGKLTLKKVYFTYRNSKMGKYTAYRFNYGEYAPLSDGSGGYYNPDEYSPGSPELDLNSTYVGGNDNSPLTGLNPSYNLKGYDTWGNYLPNSTACGNTDPLTAPEFPFVNQNQEIQDNRSQVWCMQKIFLPSGGTISVEYESDDYAHVQDKEVMRMFKVVGAGNSVDATDEGDDFTTSLTAAELYRDPIVNKANRYLYVEVDDDAVTADIPKYLKGIESGQPIYFRFLMNTTMVGGVSSGGDPAKFDYVTGYLEHEETVTAGIVFTSGGKKYMSLPVRFEDKEGGLLNSIPDLTNAVHPISKATWNFGRKYLNNFVYSDQPNGDTEDIASIVNDMLTPNVLSNLFEIFTGPNATLENKNIGRQFIAGKSWLRLNTLHTRKLGGGNRVKTIRMSDVWEEMTTGQGDYQTMSYGQQYTYTRENGSTSGVATYEPVGNKENPFVQPVYVHENRLLAPDENNFVEKPFGESFFPSPTVTYARVSVSNIPAGENVSTMQVKKRHRTGKVVTEFYTSKDYPTIVDQTTMDAKNDETPNITNLLKLITSQHLTMSQGYVIHLNDMNGKQKSQRVYAEGQATAISGVDYLYDGYSTNSGFSANSNPDANKGRLNNKVKVIHPDGTIDYQTIGVETDIVHDYRENVTSSGTIGVNTNLATFVFGVVPLPVPMLLPDISINDDQFHSVTTTKVINTFGILKETIAYDAGATVYTKNLAWDSETGEVLVTETVDEYNDKYYTFNYPAHWYYKGMSQASENLGFDGTITSSGSGYTVNGLPQASQFFVPGDELILNMLTSPQMAWVTQVNGNQIKLIDEDGVAITGGTFLFEIIRSGHRNLQSAGVMNVTLMHNPLTDVYGSEATELGPDFLDSDTWSDWKVINAGAVDYSQNWKFPCECDFDNSLEGGIYNPYRLNEKGVWRTKSSRTYLTGRNYQSSLTPRREGYMTSFSPMYKLTNSNHWYKDFTDWTFVAQVTQYSPYGFELENKDALDRYSAAQYGYNNTFPMAVGANTQYREIGFDGFEDYGFDGCPNGHFTFKGVITPLTDLSTEHSHTGNFSLKVPGSGNTSITKNLDCTIED